VEDSWNIYLHFLEGSFKNWFPLPKVFIFRKSHKHWCVLFICFNAVFTRMAGMLGQFLCDVKSNKLYARITSYSHAVFAGNCYQCMIPPLFPAHRLPSHTTKFPLWPHQ
jgi:hypothetical protein